MKVSSLHRLHYNEWCDADVRTGGLLLYQTGLPVASEPDFTGFTSQAHTIQNRLYFAWSLLSSSVVECTSPTNALHTGNILDCKQVVDMYYISINHLVSRVVK